MRTRIALTMVGVLAALAIVAAPAATAATNVHKATLHGSTAYPAVTGSAKFQRDDGVRELEAEIQHAKALAGSKVRFRVNGDPVGTATVNALGRARISKRGSSVPVVNAGSKITVRKLSGLLVASGQFS